MAAKSILIVDDNPVNSKLIRVLLAGEGYDVHTAGDADEALRVLKNLSPQLILMDVQLPGSPASICSRVQPLFVRAYSHDVLLGAIDQ